MTFNRTKRGPDAFSDDFFQYFSNQTRFLRMTVWSKISTQTPKFGIDSFIGIVELSGFCKIYETRPDKNTTFGA